MKRLKRPKYKRLQDYPKAYRDALACFEAFRRLGFSADEIFFGFDMVDEQPDMVHMQLQTQGKKFTVVVAQLPGAKQRDVYKTWDAATKLLRAMPASAEVVGTPEWHEHVWGQSLFGHSEYFATFALGVAEKGIVIPELPELAARMAHGQA